MVERGEMPWQPKLVEQAAVGGGANEGPAAGRARPAPVRAVPGRAFRRHRDRRRRHASCSWQAAGVRLDVLWCVLSRDRAARGGGPRLGGRLPRRAPSAPASRPTTSATASFPPSGAEIKAWFEQLKGRVQPDVILTHRGDDAHQDHREVSRLTWNTFRDHLILEYEIPKWDGDLGRPNVYVPRRRGGDGAQGRAAASPLRHASAPSTGSTRRRSAASRACAAWNAGRPSATRRRSTPASWRLLEPQGALQERQLRLQHGDDGLGLAEAVRLAGDTRDRPRRCRACAARRRSGATARAAPPCRRGPGTGSAGALMPSIRLMGERAANTSFHLAGVVPIRRCR